MANREIVKSLKFMREARENIESSSNNGYKVQLEQYEGPLDLLLDLIKKQNVNIHDIPIAKITGQYLEYIHQLEKHDIDVSADFIYMAASLIYIKSKMLLPVDPLAEGEEDDPRKELVHRLLEHEQFKNAAQMLLQKQQIEAHVWSRPDTSLYETDAGEGELVVNLTDIVRVFSQILERRKEVSKIELKHEQFTIAQMMERLRKELNVAEDGVGILEFFEACPSRHAMIVAFLAMLEMVRMQAILLTQKEQFAEIRIRKHKMFDAVFTEEGAVAKIEEQYL